MQALLHEHVRKHAPTSEEHTGPGIVFFDAVSQPVCDLVRESSRNGLERVLAVATFQTALTGNSVWRLLHSGASDVFAWDHSTQPAREIGGLALQRLQAMQERHQCIGDVRGIGAMVAMELVTDRATREPAGALTNDVLRYCHAHGLVLLKAGLYDNVIRLLFPLVISEQELDRGLDILEEALVSVDA